MSVILTGARAISDLKDDLFNIVNYLMFMLKPRLSNVGIKVIILVY